MQEAQHPGAVRLAVGFQQKTAGGMGCGLLNLNAIVWMVMDGPAGGPGVGMVHRQGRVVAVQEDRE